MNQPRDVSVCNADEGRDASWNEKFKFQINSTAANAQHKLIFRIMDHDNMSSDDFLGQAT
jgi:Ca2+-dependent lipid-binding protein